VGWIGRSRLDAIAASGYAEIGAVADPALPDALDSLEELLEQDVDGIVIATPSGLHAEQAVACLQRKKAVFCQKPLGRNGDETWRVVETARAYDRLLGVDFSYRSAEAFRTARAEVTRGNIGEPFAANLTFHNAYGPDNAWFYDAEKAGGGCLIDLGIHLIDFGVWALGQWERVEHASVRGVAVEDFAAAAIRFENDVIAHLECSWNLHAGREAIIEATVYGTEGGVSVTNVDGSFYDFRCERFNRTSRETVVEPPDEWPGRAAVEWARRLAVSPGFDDELVEDARSVAAAIDAIYELAR